MQLCHRAFENQQSADLRSSPPNFTSLRHISLEMSTQRPEDIVEEMDQPTQEQFITAEDTLEVEEYYHEDAPMDSDDEGEQGEGAEGGEDGFYQDGDGAENLLDNGFDDSFAQFVGHEAAVFAVALHPVDPLVAVSGGEDDLAHLWRTDTGETIIQLDGHTDSVTSVGFSFDGEMVATGGMDGRVRIWRKVKGTEGFLQWELLISLEGPDEVNVSGFLSLPNVRPKWLTHRFPTYYSGSTGTPRVTSSSPVELMEPFGSGTVSFSAPNPFLGSLADLCLCPFALFSHQQSPQETLSTFSLVTSLLLLAVASHLTVRPLALPHRVLQS